MSETLDLGKAKRQLDAAIRIANSSEPVPEKWVSITNNMSSSTSKTYIAFLGAALLAKATNGKVDPASIKPEDHRPRSFSIRGLAHNVLVPASGGTEYPPFDLGATGPEPINNQPFFRYSHLDDFERVRSKKWLNQLKKAAREADKLNEDEAVLALAAYIRCRTEVYTRRRVQAQKKIGSVSNAMILLDRLEAFVDHKSAVTFLPLRLQAVVGGLVRASGAQVSSQRLHDPSRHSPGDVHVPDQDNPWWVAEVKNRPLEQHEAELFVERASKSEKIQGVAIVIVHPDHKPLKRRELSVFARQHGLLVTVCESMRELLSFIVAHPSAEPPMVEQVSEAIAFQLEDMNAPAEILEEWYSLFDTMDSAT